MLKNILKLEGVQQLKKVQQSGIMGGVDKCCIRKPPNGLTDAGDEEGWCNSSPACCGVSRCACYPCTPQQ